MKNVTPYKLDPEFEFLKAVQRSRPRPGSPFEAYVCQPCGKLDALKIGFVANPDGYFELRNQTGVHLTIRIAEKRIPAQTINDHVTEQVKRIELETGRKVLRKERNSLKDEAYFELLPHAFVTRTDIEVTIVEHAHLVLIGTASANKAEHTCSKIREVLGSFPVTPLDSEELTSLVTVGPVEGDPEPLGDIKLEHPKHASTATFKSFEVDPRVDALIDEGFRVKELAIGYLDQFTATYTTGRVLKSLKLGEELIGGATAECETAADAWHATKAIETHALTQFYARNI